MSNYEPNQPYVYQPDPINSPHYPVIYALAGPRVPKEYRGKRYTKRVAENILKKIQQTKDI